MMESEWTFVLTLKSKRTSERFSRAIDIPFSAMGERFVPNMRLDAEIGFSSGHADEMFEALRIKQFRRNELIALAQTIGGQLVNHIEDCEGWHGEERQEANLRQKRLNEI